MANPEASIARLVEALEWAVPLAAQALGNIATERARAGHVGLGTRQSCLYDHEVEALAIARQALSDHLQESASVER